MDTAEGLRATVDTAERQRANQLTQRARVLPAGDRGLLVEVDDLDTVLALADRLRSARLAGVQDVVPASRTVLVRTEPAPDLRRLATEIADLTTTLDVGATTDTATSPLLISVRYDGPDLAEVAAITGLTPAAVIAAHTGTPWRGAFAGFAPGFCYLTGGDPRLDLPRRHESRTSVPAGSVALAGGFSAVYPRESPGGWQLIGTTDAVLWDVNRQPPALLQSGGWVRFVDADADEKSPHAGVAAGSRR